MHALAIARRAGKAFVRDGMPLHAAALAFFTLLAVVPLFALVILGAGLWLDDPESTRAWLENGAGALFGDARGAALQTLIEGTDPGGGAGTLVLTLALLLFAATRLMSALECSFNIVWDVQPESPDTKHGWFVLVLRRITSWVTVLGVGFLLLVTLGLGSLAASLLPSGTLLWQAGRLLATALVTFTVLWALYWKLPHAEVRSTDAARAAAFVAVLLTGGERALAMLVGGEHLTAVYGGLAAVIAALLWFYYASLALLAGAELAHARAVVRGEPPAPAETATRKGDTSKADTRA